MRVLLPFLIVCAACAGEVRMRNFTVNPSTGPLGAVDVYDGRVEKVTVVPPEGWVIEPGVLDTGSGTAPFRVVKAREVPDNAYVFTVNGQSQTVSVASAPYGKLKIDGRAEKMWDDGIPLSWETSGKKTTLRMFWNEDAVYAAIEAEGEIKAAQLFFGFRRKDGTEVRHELVLPVKGKCVVLSGTAAQETDEVSLESRTRKGQTVVEAAIPVELLKGIRFDAGREFYFSMLVHGADGSIRDLGERLNRPESARKKGFWRTWSEADCSGKAVYDGWSIFGCCSSIH